MNLIIKCKEQKKKTKMKMKTKNALVINIEFTYIVK